MKQSLPHDQRLKVKRKSDGQIGMITSIDWETSQINVHYEYRGTWDLNVDLHDYELIKPTDQ